MDKPTPIPDEGEPSITELADGIGKFARVLQEAVTLRRTGKAYMAVASDKQILEAINRLVSEPTKMKITGIVRTNGLDDPETERLFKAWVDANLARIELTTEANDPRPGIAFLVTRAGMYFSAGYLEEASEDLEDAKNIAMSTSNADLIEELRIEEKIKLCN